MTGTATLDPIVGTDRRAGSWPAIGDVPADGDLASGPATVVSVSEPMLGGRVGAHVIPAPGPAGTAAAERDARRAVRRIGAWAAHLTRFDPGSDLCCLNDDAGTRVPVRPILAAVLDWARTAEAITDGAVDVTLLDARLAAERGGSAIVDPSRAWSLDRMARAVAVRRPAGVRFDLDGVAKGWLADRALALLADHPSALVDGDGDLAVRLAPGASWSIGVADPRADGATLAVLTPTAPSEGPGRAFGLATSGTSVHRWARDGGWAHHLIDPRSGLPARTDLVQATVLAGTARHAEALAKAAIIAGADAAVALLDRPDVDGALLLTERGDVLATPRTLRWLS